MSLPLQENYYIMMLIKSSENLSFNPNPGQKNKKHMAEMNFKSIKGTLCEI